MSAATLISVEEYLNTSYRPDMEYVDGVLVETNVGDLLHSAVQSNIDSCIRQEYPDDQRRVPKCDQEHGKPGSGFRMWPLSLSNRQARYLTEAAIHRH